MGNKRRGKRDKWQWEHSACMLRRKRMKLGTAETVREISCSVYRAALYNLLQIEATWSTNFLNMFIAFLYTFRGKYVPIIRRNNFYLCDTWYLLFCVDDCNPFQAHSLEQSHHPTQPFEQEKCNTK